MNNSVDLSKDKWKKLILEIIEKSSEPVGSWYIVNELKKDGVEVSSATIGRELNQLEMLGYVEKQSYKGRLITESGRRVINEVNNSLEIDYYRNNLEEIISNNILENFLMVLEAREAIERLTTHLAAERITDEELEELGKCVTLQKKHIDENKSITKDDIHFHSSIAKASKNEVLFSLYMILANMGQQSELFEHMRFKVGDFYSDTHKKILDALNDRDPERAEKYMLEHINRLKDDVKKYWSSQSL